MIYLSVIPFASGKTHLAYSEGYEVVRVCDSVHVIDDGCYSEDTDMAVADMCYWDDFNLTLTCKRCLKWKGL